MSFLYDYQLEAVKNMHKGCILNGGVGSGKSRTSLYYYFTKYGGVIEPKFKPLNDAPALYIITTARKRDTKEWEAELLPFYLSSKESVTVDSWNNIQKYKDIRGAFFIFDEDRVTGTGAWAKSFIKIARNNDWILLSATPGDQWRDYEAVFIANGFYKNKTEFEREHIVWDYRAGFPRLDRYLNTGRLIRLRNNILIDMDFKRKTIAHQEHIYCLYDSIAYKKLWKDRWNPYEDKPIENASELCYCLRKLCNTSTDRLVKTMELAEKHPKVIIFYNYDYELEALKNLAYMPGTEVAEWNGHKHQEIPDSERWVYLVNYNAGAEGWNCIKTDTIIFYSQTYSYKTLIQAAGRIDRLNTPFTDLYYYHLKSKSPIDISINRALVNKKKFNERKFCG